LLGRYLELGRGASNAAPSDAVITGVPEEFVVMKKLEPSTEQALEKSSPLTLS
jgi:hypothetical protein